MIDAIIHYSIRNKLAVVLLLVLWLGWGIWSVVTLPIDAVPDITNNQVQVVTRSPSLAPLEIERYVTAPIELAMANIPGRIQTRSTSRFGLSVVTLVFEDDVDLYWARAQVLERLTALRDVIPPGYGTPEMAPVTTGLGEIYQYTLHFTQPRTDTVAAAMELRSIQDWIVRPNLLGIPGVADISSFGGYLKEYQVQLKPDQLMAAGLTIDDVYNALAVSNGNAGGAYIENAGKAYFIRGEGQVATLDDIAKTVIRTKDGVPILMRDVATVTFGSAVRYGALSMDGQGEVVGGIILMQKGENALQVIDRVHAQVEKVRATLPPGVVLEPFLDRSDFVGRTTATVRNNLIEGGLIVVFVLVLLLGSFRAGLIVASVIPLAMLFAIGLMRAFGVSGNLMSLGAIDFGLVVDGAVIIVENVVRRFSEHVRKHHNLSRTDQEDVVYHAAVEIRSSAAFGEIIILIVYVPLLFLAGIEGKMFQPMALTVCFAILGALILSLTYVPMMCAAFLSPKDAHAEGEGNFADSIINALYGGFYRFFRRAMRVRKAVVAGAVVLLVLAVGLFMRMGGEFLPRLDEGDYALEVRLPVGVSLTETLRISAILERELKTRFPNEVKHVISKIGTAEIPTDPMPIEANDLMVILKPQDEWTIGSKAELTEKIAEFIHSVPGVGIAIQQPIEMRFNELISGAKSDVVVQVFGHDLSELSRQADRIAALVRKTDGVADVVVQAVEGLPQIQVVYDRTRMATYGITVDQINRALQTAFAGATVGTVYENDWRFGLTLRYGAGDRTNVESVRLLRLQSATGAIVPLEAVADVKLQNGPAEITREQGSRRVNIGFNVRGRDVESVVGELSKVVDAKVKLLPGYRVAYGGQFENLRSAKARLAIVVPIALAAIFLLLYLTFHSVTESLLVFAAIPFAAVGGVLALTFRGLPFSISAAVGFIALFGVAVLNGIVMVAFLNQLKAEGMRNRWRRIYTALRIRFRPVLVTAMVASLGFLPMALSHGAGGEVQRPLATVVIGGLVSSTLLTLLVLPAIYSFLFRNTKGEQV